jgi:hypothetical protein
MSFAKHKEGFTQDLTEIKDSGLWKAERIIASDQKNNIVLCSFF